MPMPTVTTPWKMDTRHAILQQMQDLADAANYLGDRELSDAIAAAIIRVRRSEESGRDA